jgi:hypothetical protein
MRRDLAVEVSYDKRRVRLSRVQVQQLLDLCMQAVRLSFPGAGI